MPQALTLDRPLNRPINISYRSRDLGEPVKPICVGLEPADLARLDALAIGQQMNRSALVRRAIKNLLASSPLASSHLASSKNLANTGEKGNYSHGN